MGWTYTHRGNTPVKEFLADTVNCENDKRRWTLLDIAIVKMRTAYMAVEIIDRNESGEFDLATRKVVAFIFLLDYRPKDYYDTGYKDMDETVGPYSFECPERILNLLTPTTHEESLEWRKRCRENLEKRKTLKAKRQALKTGDFVKLDRPVTFSDRIERELFKIVNFGRTLHGSCVSTGVLCRLTGLVDRMTVISAEEMEKRRDNLAGSSVSLMKRVSRQAETVLKAIIAELGSEDHVKIDNTNGTYMPVVVERLVKVAGGTLYSVAHYGEQNGDLMRDPDVEFLHTEEGFFPISFRNDYAGAWQEVGDFNNPDGSFACRNLKQQREIADFVNSWMENIQHQQAIAV